MLFIVVATITGCQTQPIDDPAATARARDAPTPRRVRAVRETPDADARALMPLILSSRHPAAVRREAVDRMIRADPDAFWRDAASNIRRIDDWPMIQLLVDRAVVEQRTDFVPALVQSWARPSIRYTDDERPERAAVARLVPGHAVTETVWGLFRAEPADAQGLRVAEAAWTVLRRTAPPDFFARRVPGLTSGHPLHRGLRRVAPSVDELPRDREELLRMHSLVASSGDDDWDRREAVMRYNHAPGDRPGVSLRHLPAIDHSHLSAERPPDPTAWRRELSGRLAGARHVSRGEGDIGNANIRSTPDRLVDHARALGWADLLVIRLTLEALANPALVASLFEQADADRQDTTSEHGGVLTWDDAGAVVAQPFEPLMRRHDEIYIASDDCIEAMHTGLAHYHFHAQRYDNAAWAGPGGGDFKFADNLHANCVVFTFIDRDTLNADLYFPGEVVVDLGCIRR